jgi:hypothetical protein
MRSRDANMLISLDIPPLHTYTFSAQKSVRLFLMHSLSAAKRGSPPFAAPD